jgi:hypothetical protein
MSAWSKAPRILDIGCGGWWVVSFTLRSLYPRYSFDMRLSRRSGYGKEPFPWWESNSGRLAHSTHFTRLKRVTLSRSCSLRNVQRASQLLQVVSLQATTGRALCNQTKPWTLLCNLCNVTLKWLVSLHSAPSASTGCFGNTSTYQLCHLSTYNRL